MKTRLVGAAGLGLAALVAALLAETAGETVPTAADHVALGKSYYARGEYSKARTEFDWARAKRPQTAEEFLAVAGFALLRGQAALAQRVLDQALALAPRDERIVWMQAECRRQAANRFRDKGRFDEAYVEYRTALVGDADSPLVHADLARSLVRQGRRDEGIQEFRFALRLDPEAFAVWNALAEALLAGGKTEEAEEAARRSLELLPGWPVSAQTYGVLCEKLGNMAGARAAFEIAARPQALKAPREAEKARLAEAGTHLERLEAGVTEPFVVEVSHPEVTVEGLEASQERMREAARQSGHPNEVVEQMVQEATRRHVERELAAVHALLRRSSAKGCAAAESALLGEEALQKAVADARAKRIVLIRWSGNYYDDERVDFLAERAFAGAQRLAPKSAAVWADTAVFHLRRGRAEEARRACQSALKVSPGDAFATYVYGRAYLYEGKAKKAVKVLSAIVDDPVYGAMARRHIDEIGAP